MLSHKFTTPKVVAAVGGDSTATYIASGTTAPTYRVHVFTTLGKSTFRVLNKHLVCDILICAGGGGGGANHGAGAGAGGMRIIPATIMPPDEYGLYVGNGGYASSYANARNGYGWDGEPSWIKGLTGSVDHRAKGGGGAGGNSDASYDFPGRAGGSGGGGKSSGGAGAAVAGGGTFGTAIAQGYVGGAGNGQTGSGGGAGGNGLTGTGGPLAGGAGRANFYRDGNSSGTTAGIHIFCGGGGNYQGGSGAGGSGGGGAGQGSVGQHGTTGSGAANTGGGGGGYRAGGSGIIVIRYAIT